MLQTTIRNGNRWTINECLQLQREFELLNLSIDEIAFRHKRTPNAIMFRLDKEGFADYKDLRNCYNLKKYFQTTNDDNDNDDDCSEEQVEKLEEDEKDDLQERVTHLEKQVIELREIIMKSKNKSVFHWFD